MASLTTRKTGSRAVQFTAADGKRKTVSLGRLPARQAAGWPAHIEAIVQAQKFGGAVPDATAAWISTLSGDHHERLAAAGLLVSRQTREPALGDRLAGYLADREAEGEIKPASLKKLRQTVVLLIEYFPPEMRLDQLTAADARGWSGWLVRERKLSRASQRTHHGNSRTMYRSIFGKQAENPFAGLPARTTASDYRRYITPEEIERVIQQAPTAEWRLLLGLARYAGLRTPSESHLLTVADVDFEARRILVHSPKTERHAGHESRLIPIDHRLLPLLLDRIESMEPGEERLIALSGLSSNGRTVRRLCRRAGVEPWRRTWQTLRSSAEIDWAARLPQYAVSKWIGHSMTISERHYANMIPDEIFERASAEPIQPPATTTATTPKPQRSQALQNALQQMRAGGRIDAKQSEPGGNRIFDNVSPLPDLRSDALACGYGSEWSRGELNTRTPRQNTGETADSTLCAAECAAADAPGEMFNLEMRLLMDRWRQLPEDLRTDVLERIVAA